LSQTELEGYHGEILEHLRKASVKIGNLVRVTSKAGEVYEGYLIPRYQYGDHNHIVLKLPNGYNVGIHLGRTEKIEVIGEGEKPKFTKPPPIQKRPNLPKVSIISTGGTIASRVDYRTGAVEPALSAEDLASVVPELASMADIDAHILYSEYSENLTPTHWKGMAEEVSRRIAHGADGVIVTHGTDTMHYSAAALSFALQNLPVPVILVGAQRSSDRPSSDAATNLIGGTAIAATADISGVGVAMHEEISDHHIVAHKGTRVRKCHTSRRDTFRSIETRPLARYNLTTRQLETIDSPTKRDKKRNLTLKANFDPSAFLLKAYPGFDNRLIDSAVQHGARGIVLEGTGLGHVARNCHDSIHHAVKKDIPVFMTSQTIWGRVDMNVYYPGRDLLNLGVTPLEDMIPETALVKLMWTLAQTESPDEIKSIMLQPLAGEILPRTPYLIEEVHE
jgi:glutamyl-tRNA(Gln) amidotransferase subunit D